MRLPLLRTKMMGAGYTPAGTDDMGPRSVEREHHLPTLRGYLHDDHRDGSLGARVRLRNWRVVSEVVGVIVRLR